jgi:general secretion pathway protein C
MLDLFFRKYAWTANLLLLLLAAWFSARIVNTLVGAVIRPRPQADLTVPAPAGPRAAAPLALDDGKLYHLLGVEPPAQVAEAGAAPAARRPQNCADAAARPVRSELRLSLVAAVLADPARASLATIADLSTRENKVVGVGDRIASAELLGLERLRPDGVDLTGNAFRVVAVICNEGTKEYVEPDAGPAGEVAAAGLPNLGTAPLPRPPGPPGAPMDGVRTVGNNRYEIDRKVIDTTLSDMNQIATQARIVPSFKNGVANGFKLFSIQPGSLYSSIGVENGDVIQRINGYEINSPEKALELYQKLRESSHVTIELERNGQPVRKEYSITGP